jgi:AmiR/NasT family two-component response regulator
MIMERFSIDAVHAFELLKKLSQQSNTRIVEIASNLVARGSEPTTEGER